jgi:hypothetical protein
MLSFTVMHDTVIHVLDSNDKLPISEYVENTKHVQDVTDIHDMHDIFHFIALIPTIDIFLVPLEKSNRLSNYLLQYTLTCLQHNNKPPIV